MKRWADVTRRPRAGQSRHRRRRATRMRKRRRRQGVIPMIRCYPPRPPRSRPFHVMAKPIGPICNLDCRYCFYLEKEKLYPAGEHFRMTDDVLEAFIRQYIGDQDAAEITFGWQGGEPTLMGVGFLPHRPSHFNRSTPTARRIPNTLQTNATLLDDEWAAFLAEHEFLVGVSIDGPPSCTTAIASKRSQQPTFRRRRSRHRFPEEARGGVQHAHRRQPRELADSRWRSTASSRRSARAHPVYPVGRTASPMPTARRSASISRRAGDASPVTDWSVEPEQFGEFLVQDLRGVGACTTSAGLRATVRRDARQLDAARIEHVRVRRACGRGAGRRAQRRPVFLRSLRLPAVQARQPDGAGRSATWWRRPSR